MILSTLVVLMPLTAPPIWGSSPGFPASEPDASGRSMFPASLDAPPSSEAPPEPVELEPPLPPTPDEDVPVAGPVVVSVLEETEVPAPPAPPAPSVVEPVAPGPVVLPLVAGPAVEAVVFALPESEPQAASIALEASAIQRSEDRMGLPFFSAPKPADPARPSTRGRSLNRSASSLSIRCNEMAPRMHFCAARAKRRGDDSVLGMSLRDASTISRLMP